MLIVDDEKAILFAMGDYFEVRGYEVDCARDRTEAERLLAERGYAALITDLRLTGSDDVDGLHIAAYALERQPSLCIILLTAYGTPEIRKSAHAQGVIACLSKPSPLDQIADTVSKLLGRAA
ncbi:MAG: response regulator [Gammaproteobacteria bacterium]